ncbi:MAG: hypothetical protein QMC96_02200 [Methanomicrobiales archaeon]|nr:hypothetical protein [Methanomicrobiales archaeon]
MVNDEGQLYTLEGIAAALIMLVSMYLVLGTTVVYTPGDTHITDMQLEQLGSDALRMMDTPSSIGNESDLVKWVKYQQGNLFAQNFTSYIQSRATTTDTGLQFNATICYRQKDSTNISCYPFANSTQPYSGRDPAVRVTRWVQVEWDNSASTPSIPPPPTQPGIDATRPQVVLLEVLIWRS